jgi:lysophospholipid acyltransferase (LPLAT)-like uncharacterized protein
MTRSKHINRSTYAKIERAAAAGWHSDLSMGPARFLRHHRKCQRRRRRRVRR